MRTQKELSQFIVLRSNGWSLAKISKHLNIPKTTLFRWEEKNADTIHLLRYVQLEKIQEQYVPSYEEQLKDTHEHLQKIQAALKQRDYSTMSPEFLLQMNFQLQTRLDKIRQQVPLRGPQFGALIEALPPVGCVTKDEDFPREGDFSDPDPNIEGEPELEPPFEVGRGVPAEPPSETASACPAEASEQRRVPASQPSTDNGPRTTDGSPKHPIVQPSINPVVNGHTNGNGHVNGNGHHHRNGSLRDLRASVVNPASQNGTFRNETPPGVENGPLQINDLQQPKRNDRSV